MLKKQGIVKQDPKFDERLMLPTPPPRYFLRVDILEQPMLLPGKA